MSQSPDLPTYYACRAQEYEHVYAKPERQVELAKFKKLLPQWLAGQDVLEIACGTGYWTQFIAKQAHSILATDLNDEVLAIAGSKEYPPGKVRFVRADAFRLAEAEGTFSAMFAGFWWSHVPKGRRGEFLQAVRARLRPGALVVLVDNQYVAGSCSPMSSHVDAGGNTYSQRRLEDGSTWNVLKNFPTEDELRRDLSAIAQDVEYGAMNYYWWAKCHVGD
jgi:demethylmenaquinone methyltransferase/2-methoxy-6-polyprenyl-1,4-benzoquinol methylase